MFNNTRREAAHTDAVLDQRVASLLEAAAAPSEPGPLTGEQEAVAAFVESRKTPRRFSMIPALTTAKVSVAAALSGVLLTGGVGAAAATGSLPGAAQDTASEWLAKVGVTVPGSDERAAVHDDQRGDADTVADDGDAEHGDRGKGEAVSELAQDDELSGRDKGAAVSDLASDGRSRAGEQGGEGAADEAKEGSGAAAGDAASRRSANSDSADDADTAGTNQADDTADDAADDAADDDSAAGTDQSDGAGGGRPDTGSGERP